MRELSGAAAPLTALVWAAASAAVPAASILAACESTEQSPAANDGGTAVSPDGNDSSGDGSGAEARDANASDATLGEAMADTSVDGGPADAPVLLTDGAILLPDGRVVGADDAAVNICRDAAAADAAGPCCPNDPFKVQPGQCGCGISDYDTDGDGVADCLDGCPKDPARKAPGTCGCGEPDNLRLCLAHRYSFGSPDGGPAPRPADAGGGSVGGSVDAGSGAGGGGGAVVPDSVGNADGRAVNVSAPATGGLVLNRTAGLFQYVLLPSGIVSALGPHATVEVWLEWTGGAAWQRVFDFGSNDMLPGLQGTGQQYLFVTPDFGGALRGAFSLRGLNAETIVDDTAPLPSGTVHHVALVMNPGASPAGVLQLYKDGALVQQKALPAPSFPAGPLAMMTLVPGGPTQFGDVNNWIGLSQFANDPVFTGAIYELRIYGAARSAAQIQASFAAGPATLPPQ